MGRDATVRAEGLQPSEQVVQRRDGAPDAAAPGRPDLVRRARGRSISFHAPELGEVVLEGEERWRHLGHSFLDVQLSFLLWWCHYLMLTYEMSIDIFEKRKHLETPDGSRSSNQARDGPLCHDLGMLVEAVPNYSEGRRIEVVDRLAAAITSTPGAYLLDRTSDASHNRSVLTLAGEAPAVVAALHASVGVALEAIDMEVHRGEHPRVGAVDVVPFVPLGDTTIDDCIELARSFGRDVAARQAIPVYLYARAATRPDRVRLADVRRGGYEGVRDEIATMPERIPDFGPRQTHRRGGAMAVGARPFLIAWNINLESNDLELAKRIARTVRTSGGGLPAVQANGFMIEELDSAQVSMNLLDFATTPMWQAWEAVESLAGEAGVGLSESELIGLAPLAAFDAVAVHAGVRPDVPVEERFAAAAAAIRLRDATPAMALELRLAAARATTPPSS
jgi:glutamate formiminotransferase / 5-formyltetrahydrofolate cyclo-ligase